MEKEFWEDIYQSGRTRFDLQAPTIPLCDFLDSARLTAGRALVPGCGRGHDVVELARRGWNVLGVDFAPSAVRDSTAAIAKAKLESRATIQQADLFTLESPPVDLWWENTCYCAIEPRRREDYARLSARLVKPGGLLLFLIFPLSTLAPLQPEGGPPFLIDPAEIEPRFEEWFALERLEVPPRPSSESRTTRETLAVLRRK